MSFIPAEMRTRSHVLAVGGGKGGSGKSFIAANIGINLSKRGQRVIMVDTDLGGANLHTLLGLSPPRLPSTISLTGELGVYVM
jgi:flagellar biosynthesis protein FlhG